jgi:hypothetical protein
MQTLPTVPGLPAAVILHGMYADGGGLSEIYARVQGPAGVYWTAVNRTATTWRFAPELMTLGDYTITLQAYDRAGNSRSYGPFHLTVQEAAHAVYLPLILNRP